MNTEKRKPRFLAGFLTAALALTLGAGVPAVYTEAAETQTEVPGETEAQSVTETELQTEKSEAADAPETEAQTEIQIAMKSSIETPATPGSAAKIDGMENTAVQDTTATDSAAGGTLNGAQGLSLSTASEVETESIQTTQTVSTGSMSMGQWIVTLTISLTLSGLILLGAAAGLVYFFRRNWNRWGGEDDEE